MRRRVGGFRRDRYASALPGKKWTTQAGILEATTSLVKDNPALNSWLSTSFMPWLGQTGLLSGVFDICLGVLLGLDSSIAGTGNATTLLMFACAADASNRGIGAKSIVTSDRLLAFMGASPKAV